MIKNENKILDKLKGKLVVSCQPVDNGPMDSPEIITSMALAAENGGAGGLRIEGIENLKIIRPKTKLPIIGIIKRDSSEYNIRITPLIKDVENLAIHGADIIGYDASSLSRPCTTSEIVKKIKEMNILAMSDCGNLNDGITALKEGSDILGTTLSGYIYNIVNPTAEPDFELIKEFHNLGAFTMAEGRYNSPDLARKAIEAGADSVTVGSAITRVEHITSWFANVINKNDSI